MHLTFFVLSNKRAFTHIIHPTQLLDMNIRLVQKKLRGFGLLGTQNSRTN